MRLTNEEKILNLLGLAYKARKVIIGEENVINGLRDKKCRMVFVATDASEKTIDKFQKKCFFYQTELLNKFTTDELSNALGKGLVKIVALTDEGFCSSVNKLLK